MRVFLVIFLLVFIVGCEDYPIYEKFTTSKKSFECLSLDVNDSVFYNILKNKYNFKQDSRCDYKLRGYIHNSLACTSTYAKTYGSDFNGYTYLEISQKHNILYRVQSDFKDDVNGLIDRIVTKINNVINK